MTTIGFMLHSRDCIYDSVGLHIECAWSLEIFENHLMHGTYPDRF